MKNKSIIFGVLFLLLIIILGLGFFKFNFTYSPINIEGDERFSFSDGTYIINGEQVILVNGVSKIATTSDSALKTTTRYFGNEVKKDLNKDGREDITFIVTQETSGSGAFFYVVALLNTDRGPVGSHGLFLGDRIAPQPSEIGKGNIIIINYTDRKPGESFTVKPSVGKSLWLLLDTKTMQFGEVAQNFEGEADPKRMTLDMHTWTWINTIYSNDKEVRPLSTKKFTITFKDNRFSATTDCNSVGGEYLVNGNKIIFSKMMSTLMYCENSQESDFIKMLGETQSYLFTSKGELVFDLKFDSGSMIFR